MYFIYLIDQRRWKLLVGVLDLESGWARISWETQKLWKLTIIIWILFGKSWLYILMISSAFIRYDDKLCFRWRYHAFILFAGQCLEGGIILFLPIFFLFSFWSIYWKFETFLIMTIIWILHGKSWLYILMIKLCFHMMDLSCIYLVCRPVPRGGWGCAIYFLFGCSSSCHLLVIIIYP